MKTDISRFAPPGLDLKPLKDTLTWGLIWAALYSCGFLIRYAEANSSLYAYGGVKRELLRGAVMPQFSILLDRALVGFWILAACMLGWVIYHYSYYRQGSKSIYLMRRLPNRFELHRRCLTLPLLAAAVCLLTAILLLMGYYGIYLVFTPRQCLVPQEWPGIWRVL